MNGVTTDATLEMLFMPPMITSARMKASPRPHASGEMLNELLMAVDSPLACTEGIRRP